VNLADQIDELSPSAQKAVQTYVSALHMTELLIPPARSSGNTNAVADPRRVPGSLDAAGTHRVIVGLAYRARSTADRCTRRMTGDVAPRDGCTATERGEQCGRPLHAKGLCVTHYRRVQRRNSGTRKREAPTSG